MTPTQAGISGGILAALAVTGAVVWLERQGATATRQDVVRQTEVVARQFSSRIAATLDRHRVGLEQFANFWSASEEVTVQEFRGFAAKTVALTPLCRRISMVDGEMRIRWVYPPDAEQQFAGFDVQTHALGYRALARARSEARAILSPPLELLDGTQGLVLGVPIQKDGEFLGSLVCAIRASDFFQTLVLPEVAGLYVQAVSDEGVLLYASDPAAKNLFSLPVTTSKSIEFAGRRWDIAVAPRPEVLAAKLAHERLTFWILGSVAALMAGLGAAVVTERQWRTRRDLQLKEHALRETRHDLEEAIEQLLQAEKLATLGELVAGVAHELNNPLASVLGYSELALRADPPEKVRRYLQIAMSEAERAGKIVRNLLTFARKQASEKKPQFLNEIVEKTLELRAYHFRTSQIRVERDFDPTLPKTMLDGQQIQQVVLNLLNNAAQAIAERGRGGTIRVVTRRAGDRMQLVVSDDGPGVPPEVQARIFEPFFTTKKDGKGTGLGLPLCSRIVEEHGGRIWVESKPGEGATFVVELPIVEGREGTDDTPRAAEAVALPAGLRILLVDDEPGVQAFFSDLLQGRGHHVETTSDVPEALERLAASHFDLIIADLRMPHGTGEDIYRAAKRKSPRLARRIIFTTGENVSPRTEHLVQDLGVAVLHKPCKIEEIERALAQVIQS